eukprot:TRINITY_DN46775_c0_g1_i1.p1 TRINITY_DN46775_c0_g1~~TRINITY_DN46775_c0_g1_i1.p1  ORF type:complete len:653 (+),score=78.06 TRINITY_DN46775_c0_g1_i1:302-2260(+)
MPEEEEEIDEHLQPISGRTASTFQTSPSVGQILRPTSATANRLQLKLSGTAGSPLGFRTGDFPSPTVQSTRSIGNDSNDSFASSVTSEERTHGSPLSARSMKTIKPITNLTNISPRSVYQNYSWQMGSQPIPGLRHMLSEVIGNFSATSLAVPPDGSISLSRPQDITAFLETLALYEGLSDVSLTDCHLNDTAIQILSEIGARFPALQRLDVSFNVDVTAPGVVALTQLALDNPSLKHIICTKISCDDSSLIENLMAVLQRNRSTRGIAASPELDGTPKAARGRHRRLPPNRSFGGIGTPSPHPLSQVDAGAEPDDQPPPSTANGVTVPKVNMSALKSRPPVPQVGMQNMMKTNSFGAESTMAPAKSKLARHEAATSNPNSLKRPHLVAMEEEQELPPAGNGKLTQKRPPAVDTNNSGSPSAPPTLTGTRTRRMQRNISTPQSKSKKPEPEVILTLDEISSLRHTLQHPATLAGMSWRAVYTHYCRQYQVQPAAELVIDLPAGKGINMSALYLPTGCKLGVQGIRPVSELIRMNSQLRHIVLSNVGLTDNDVPWLVHALMEHPKVSSIDLSNNPLSTAGASEILSLVTDNPAITTLYNSGWSDVDPALLEMLNSQVHRNAEGKLARRSVNTPMAGVGRRDTLNPMDDPANNA